MGLDGRVALVTGGNRGIGAGIATALARDGADVAIVYRRDEQSAAATAAAIEGLGRRARTYRASVDDWDEDERMVSEVLADFGRVDIFVHSAGIASRGRTVVETDPAEIERLWRTHAFAAFAISKLVVPQMRELPRGDVVVISSSATVRWGANSSPYNMGKGALEAFAHTLAKEERRHNIHVNIVAPGRRGAGRHRDGTPPRAGGDRSRGHTRTRFGLAVRARLYARGGGRRGRVLGLRRGPLRERPEVGGRRRHVLRHQPGSIPASRYAAAPWRRILRIVVTPGRCGGTGRPVAVGGGWRSVAR